MSYDPDEVSRPSETLDEMLKKMRRRPYGDGIVRKSEYGETETIEVINFPPNEFWLNRMRAYENYMEKRVAELERENEKLLDTTGLLLGEQIRRLYDENELLRRVSEQIDLGAIEARCAAATPGPWYIVWGGYRGNSICHSVPGRVYNGNKWIEDSKQPLDEKIANMANPKRLSEDDAEFIAHARQDIPALIAEVRRLQEENERMRRL